MRRGLAFCVLSISASSLCSCATLSSLDNTRALAALSPIAAVAYATTEAVIIAASKEPVVPLENTGVCRIVSAQKQDAPCPPLSLSLEESRGHSLAQVRIDEQSQFMIPAHFQTVHNVAIDSRHFKIQRFELEPLNKSKKRRVLVFLEES